MVRIIGTHWDKLKEHYSLSWSHCRNAILDLQFKNNIAHRCDVTGLRYPHTTIITSPADAEQQLPAIHFPVVAKPAKPLSEFKAQRLDTESALLQLTRKYVNSLPFLVQQWIPGDDSHLLFGALLLQEGEVAARFEGKKLLSHPPAMGQTTAAQPLVDDEVHQAAVQFFQGLSLSGPASVEFKKDSNGHLWVIEPTVGRTDFWLGCCTANAVDLPFLNYAIAAHLPLYTTSQRDVSLWCDTDRDPKIIWYLLLYYPKLLLTHRLKTAYASVRDPAPSAYALSSLAKRLGNRIFATGLRKAKLSG